MNPHTVSNLTNPEAVRSEHKAFQGTTLEETMETRIEPLWTNKEVGAFLRIHPAVVDRMARRGDIPGIKVGKYWRYRKSDLDVWAGSGIKSDRQPCRIETSF